MCAQYASHLHISPGTQCHSDSAVVVAGSGTHGVMVIVAGSGTHGVVVVAGSGKHGVVVAGSGGGGGW